jgi:hypothetical protein
MRHSDPFLFAVILDTGTRLEKSVGVRWIGCAADSPQWAVRLLLPEAS